MMPNEFRYGENAGTHPKDEKCCGTPDDCDTAKGDPNGGHTEQDLLTIHHMSDPLLTMVLDGQAAIGALTRADERIAELNDEVTALTVEASRLQKRALQDTAVIGLYRASLHFALGLIDQCMASESTVVEADRDKLYSQLETADGMLFDIVDLRPE